MPRYAVALLLLLLAVPATAASVDNDRPPVPFDDLGGCPYPCCSGGTWRANSRTVFFEDRRPGSPVAFQVEAGERVQGLNSVVTTLSPGRVIVKKTFDLAIGRERISVPAGSILFALHAVGEGASYVWFRGNLFELEVPPGPHADGTRPPSETPVFRTENDPETVWWVAAENASGRVGWCAEPERLDDIEACE